MTTIHDVARAAGVSIATVSRAVHGSPRVAEATRHRVLVAATELGYVPSSAAAGLAGGRTNVVGVLASRFGGPSLGVVGAVAAALQDAGRQTLLVDARTATAGPAVLQRRVDGIIVVADDPPAGGPPAPLPRPDVPAVLVGAAAEGWSGVAVDHLAAGGEATRHLLALGHTAIAFVGGPGAGERLGWHEAMRAAGLGTDGLSVTVAGGTADAVGPVLSGPRPVTALVTATGELAVRVVQAARAAGRTVPHDVSVIGVDGGDLAAAVGVTSLDRPVTWQAQVAVDLLLAAIDGPLRPPVDIRLAASLHLRGTTAQCG